MHYLLYMHIAVYAYIYIYTLLLLLSGDLSQSVECVSLLSNAPIPPNMPNQQPADIHVFQSTVLHTAIHLYSRLQQPVLHNLEGSGP